MMNTLLLKISAPMQSWGTQSKFTHRDTEREPSKSGVVGLLCAALGRPRDANIEDLTGLGFGVRVDREGRLAVDFHTAQNIYIAKGGKPRDTEVSRRYYLEDAKFIVGLEGDIALLEDINRALQSPRWPLYFGRKSFVPGEPVWLPHGMYPGLGLLEAFQEFSWPRDDDGIPADRLRVVFEDLDGVQIRQDIPASFERRVFSSRRVTVSYLYYQEAS